MTILFFGLSGLDVLDGMNEVSCQDKAEMVDWIYAQQIVPNKSHSNLHQCGFRGGSFIGAPYHPASSQVRCSECVSKIMGSITVSPLYKAAQATNKYVSRLHPSPPTHTHPTHTHIKL